MNIYPNEVSHECGMHAIMALVELIQACSTDPRVQGIRSFMICWLKNRELQLQQIQTVGSKGYDGAY
ncbi:hypothetical protein BJH92_20745 [Paenibacillus polymyxa]|nr:hypothetical protein BJH92_20745 [Paenibacillus polymyxa]